jgi:hypothetical protein
VTRTPVKSSNLKSVGYDEKTSTLEVEFATGTVFQYADVPKKVFGAMMTADSVGSFFANNVRQAYPGMKVETEE